MVLSKRELVFNVIRKHPWSTGAELGRYSGMTKNNAVLEAVKLVELGRATRRPNGNGYVYGCLNDGQVVGASTHTCRLHSMRPERAAAPASARTVHEAWPLVDEPVEAEFRVVAETVKPAPARQLHTGMTQQMPAGVRGYKRPQAPARGSSVVVFDPAGAHLRQQAARIAELEQAEAEREESARRAARPPIEPVQATARMALSALLAWGSIARPQDDPPRARRRPLESHTDDWFTPREEPEPVPALTSMDAPADEAEPHVPFWRRRRQVERAPVKKSVWF
jgi:hypothetical protein